MYFLIVMVLVNDHFWKSHKAIHISVPNKSLRFLLKVYNIFSTLHSEHELEIITGLEDLWIKEDQNAVFMCELSMEDMPGEWYKNGSRIRPTSTIKTRTEGEDKLMWINYN